MRRDFIYYLLIAIALASIGLAARGALVLAPLVVALALHPWWSSRSVPRERKDNLAQLLPHLLIGTGVAVLASIWPVTDASGESIGGAFFVGYYMLCLALLKLYEQRDGSTTPRLILCTTAAHLCAGPALRRYLGRTKGWVEGPLGEALPQPHTLFIALLAPHVLLVVIALARDARLVPGKRGWRRPLQVVCFAAILAVTGVATSLLRKHYAELTRIVAELGGGLIPRQGRAGFADRSRLGSVARRQASEDQQVSLRAYAETAPGYLRGKVYTDYEAGQWSVRRAATIKKLITEGRLAFVGGASATPDIIVYPTATHRAGFFLPLRTAAVTTSCDTVEVYPARVLRSLSQPTDKGYGVVLDSSPIHDEGALPRYRGTPRDARLMKSIDALIARLELKDLPPDQVVSRMASDFARRYQYRYGIRFRRQPDPLVQFLEEKKHGHCELFASVGTLVLRRLEIPSRYVTGFVCRERNPIRKKLYLARDRHAHAWIEYYDSHRGWARAELTPPDGRPDTAPAEGKRAFGDWAGSVWLSLIELLRDGIPGLPGRLLSAVRNFAGDALTSPWTLVVLAVGALIWWLRHEPRSNRLGRDWKPRALSAGVADARARYVAIERTLAGAGLGRGRSETLHAYADRLELLQGEELEAWPALDRQETLAVIRDFAWARYGPEATCP